MAISEQHKQLRTRIETAAYHVPMLELSFREMFGGVMIYSSGKPFASLSEPGLALKLQRYPEVLISSARIQRSFSRVRR